jgi:hypothetical protein
MLSLVLVTVIVANVVLWSYQMNQLDWEKTQEKPEITYAGDESPWFTSKKYENTWTIDSAYETFREETTSHQNNYYPSDYNLLGATKRVSGTPNDLISDDGFYMTFRSYAAVTLKTNAFIAYRDSTTSLNTPKERTWDGETASWSSQAEMPNASSPVRFVRVAYCPLEQRSFEKIVVTLSDDGYLDAYVWNGISWTVTNDIARVWTTAPTGAQRPYDIVYETASGRALLVYDVVVADATKDLGYRIWTPDVGWSSEYYINFPGVASTNPIISFVELASNPDPTSNQIALAFLDQGNQDSFAAIWNGSTWTLMTTLTTTTGGTSNIRESIGVAYSTYYKKVLAVSGNGANSIVWKWYVQGENDWRTGTTFDPDPDQNNDVCFITLKPDPAGNSTHDYIMCAGVNDLADLNAWAWNMAEENPGIYHMVNEVDDSVDASSQRCVDFAWEPIGNKGLIVWGTTSGRLNYNTYSISAGWGVSWTTYVSMAGGTHPWVQLKTNPRNVDGDIKVLGAVLTDTVYDIGAIKWDGTTLTVIGTNVISSDTAVVTYECFELEFCYYGASTFMAEVEFTGKADVGTWTQLTWTVDCSVTTDDVNATFQLWNYTAGQYSTIGDGYMTAILGRADSTKSQTIIVNPADFIAPTSGEWRLKIVCVKTELAPFDLTVDLIELNMGLEGAYTLDVIVDFVLDLDQYPLEYVDSVEIQIRFRVSDTFDDWFLKAYNWASGQPDIIGEPPPATSFENYSVTLATDWQNYINSGNGIIRLEFCDDQGAGLDANQTTLDVDFFGVRLLLNGTLFTIKNSGASTIHIVSIWVINATHHERYDADFFINSGDTISKIRDDITLPSGRFVVKVVSERGNIAVFVSD